MAATATAPRAVLLQGNVAVAEGAIPPGCRFFAGYPITPSTEIWPQGSCSRRLRVAAPSSRWRTRSPPSPPWCGASLARRQGA